MTWGNDYGEMKSILCIFDKIIRKQVCVVSVILMLSTIQLTRGWKSHNYQEERETEGLDSNPNST